MKTVDRNLLRAGAMMGASQRQLLPHIVLPGCAASRSSPGLRIAVGSAWMLTVTAEMVAVKSGVGYVLWDSYYFLRYDIVLAAMSSIGLLGYSATSASADHGARAALAARFDRAGQEPADGSLIDTSQRRQGFSDSARGREVMALDDISLDIERNEFVCLLGPAAAASRRCST